MGKKSIKKRTNCTNVHDNAQTATDGSMAHYWRITTWTYIFLTINRVMSPKLVPSITAATTRGSGY